MLVVRYIGQQGGIEIKEEEISSLGDGDVLVKVMAVGICSTDGKIILGKRNIRAGIVLGHEISGEIVEIKGARKDFKVGDRVSIFPGIACKECYYCRINYQNICTDKISFGLQIDGGFQQYMKVPAYAVENGNMFKLAYELSYEEGTFLEPISCCIESINLVGVKEGDRILVVGAGVMGLLHLIMLRDIASKIIVSDLMKYRRELALELGADRVIDPMSEDLKEIILGETDGIGVDKCFMCADVPQMVELLCQVVRRRGVINLFASSIKDEKSLIDPNILHYKEVILSGSHSSTLEQFYDSIEVVNKGKERIVKLITHLLSIQETRQAIDLYLRHEAIKVIIKPN